jgi:NADH-quinone oxidoreductase subunit M
MTYHMGVDGISMPFVMLTTAIMPLCIIASWHVTKRVKEYMIAFLVLETLMIGVFCALDLVLFYLFFEGALIPMFLIIGIWGGAAQLCGLQVLPLHAAGSVLMLLAIMAMYATPAQRHRRDLLERIPGVHADLVVAGLLRIVRGEDADVAGAHLAAGCPRGSADGRLGRAGGHPAEDGRLRLPALLAAHVPGASEMFAPMMFVLSVIAIVYTSLVALMQEDMKKLIAYSSVAHMGFVTMGIFSINKQGIDGAMFQMISHGFISGALFLCVGVVYDRIHTREIAAYGGLVNRMPAYAAIFLLFTMANVGLPGTSGFVGEFLTLAGAFKANTWVAFFATTGVILSAGYALWLYRRVVFGVLQKDSLKSITDITPREAVTLVPLVIATLFFGIYPVPIMEAISASVDGLITQVNSDLAANAASARSALVNLAN